MANIRAIRARIKSVESTRKITKSMKMISASKLKKAQQAMNSLRPYAENIRRMLSDVSAQAGGSSPLLAARAAEKVCYVLIVGDRGLCGVYNTALLKHFTELIAKEEREYTIVVCGRWGRDIIAAAGLHVTRSVDTLSDPPTAEEAAALADELERLYLSGETDEIVLVYESYASALRQEPCSVRLLPLDTERREKDASDTIFEPERQSVIDRLCELYMKNAVYSALLEAKTGEHSARMTAMTAASDNTEQLIAELRLKLNHARQSAITTEISEIVGGANALASNNEREAKRGKGRS